MNKQNHRITRLSARDDDGWDVTSPLYHGERMEEDAVWSGTEEEAGLAAYLSGESKRIFAPCCCCGCGYVGNA